jgi:FkbM family methyltransferase
MRTLYRLLLGWRDAQRGVPCRLNGVTYRLDAHNDLRLTPDYEARVAAFLRQHVAPGAVCLDVGANVGAYVLQLAHWSRPTGRIIAFEPNPGARAVLERHIRLNQIGDRVVVVPAAVGATAGEAVLHAVDSSVMSRLAVPNREIADRVSPITVPVVTLDAYCQTHSAEPDWLLIDIEGFEIAALDGARELIQRRAGSLGIVVEMHPGDWGIAGTTRADAESLLAELGLHPVSLTGQDDPLAQHGAVYLARDGALRVGDG